MPICWATTNAEYSEYSDSQYKILWLGLLKFQIQYKVQNIYREKDIKKARCHRNQNITSISYE